MLPAGLHQLSLEDNPWRCDCRLTPLKRWLDTNRIPLSAPTRCFIKEDEEKNYHDDDNNKEGLSISRHHEQEQRREQTSTRAEEVARAQESASISGKESQTDGGSRRLQMTTGSLFIDQISVDHFVCAPRAPQSIFINKLPDSTSYSKDGTEPTSVAFKAFKVERLSPILPSIDSVPRDLLEGSFSSPHGVQFSLLDYHKGTKSHSTVETGESKTVVQELGELPEIEVVLNYLRPSLIDTRAGLNGEPSDNMPLASSAVLRKLATNIDEDNNNNSNSNIGNKREKNSEIGSRRNETELLQGRGRFRRSFVVNATQGKSDIGKRCYYIYM